MRGIMFARLRTLNVYIMRGRHRGLSAEQQELLRTPMPFDPLTALPRDVRFQKPSGRLGVAGIWCVAMLVACGGGSGGNGGASGVGSGTTFSVGTHSLSYGASGPTASTPAPQTVTGTVTGTLSGTLYIVVDVAGPAVANVSSFSVSGNSGQGSVSVQLPSALGIGTFTSTLTIHACINDSTCTTGELNGSPQVVNVSYTISAPPIADTVMPHVVASGISGSVVMRGSGFTGTTSISFGATPATSFTVVTDSLIQT